jgi:hypothetical protein
MKNKLIGLCLAPFLMAIQCEEDEVACGVEFTNNYSVNVENTSETYASGETVWFNGEVSSELENSCNDNQPEVVFDSTLFTTGFFVLKLTDEFVNLNAELVQDYDVTYSVGEELNPNYCAEFVYFTTELSEDNLTYSYRVGISVNAPGDYCVVAAFRNDFDNLQQDNNDQIFEPYNSLEDNIKFESCNNTYTRNGTDGHYFFSVN